MFFGKSLNKSRRYKLAAILLLVSTSLCLLYFAGRGSPWAGRHNLIGFLTVDAGGLPETSEIVAEDVKRTPGFYALLAVLIAVTDIGKSGLMFYPILLIPITVVLYALLYKLSSSHLLSAAIIGGFLISGTQGSDKVYIGLHGTGLVLIFNSLHLTLLLKRLPDYRHEILAALSLSGLSLIYISYNRAASVIFTLGFLTVLFFLAARRDFVYDTDIFVRRRRLWMLPAIALLVIFVGLVFFHSFLEGFVPFFVGQLVGETQSGLDRFFLQWLGSGSDEFPLTEIVLNKPDALVYVSAVRYLLLLGAFIIFTGIGVLALRRHRQSLSFAEMVVVAFVAAQAVFAIARMLIGDTQFISRAYYPGLLVLAVLFAAKPTWRLSENTQHRIRSYVVICVVGLLIVSAIPLPLSLSAGQVNEDDEIYRVSEAPAEWHADYVNQPIRTDEQTSNNFRYHTDEGIADIHRFTRLETILYVLNLGEKNPESAYIVLNYKLNDVPIGGWTHLVPWERSSARIHNGGLNTNVIYSNGAIRTYAPHGNGTGVSGS